MGDELIDISSDDSEEEAPPPPPPANFAQSLKEQMMFHKNNFDVSIHPQPVPEKYPAVPPQPVEKGKKRKVDYATITSVKHYQPKRKKPFTDVARITFKDIGGMDDTLCEISKLLLHISHPEIYRTIGITPPRGFLLHGPPGCGKTILANAIAGVSIKFNFNNIYFFILSDIKFKWKQF